MPRHRERDRAKEWQWRRLLRQWRRSGQTVQAFCLGHNLSMPSFYAWRRTIAQRDREGQRGQRKPQDTRDDRRATRGDRPPVFVPVRVTPAAAALEVVLRDGRLVRVPSGFDAATLRQLLAVLEEAPPC